ncbi:MAG: hypothetical protein QXP20_05865, partial [Candidatus Bathyarchaeia archaeon]
MPEVATVEKLKNLISFHAIEVSVPHEGRIFVQVSKDHIRNVIASLKDEGFTHLVGITALQTKNGFE